MRRAIYPLLGGIMALGFLGAASSAHAAIMWTFGPGDEFSGTNETLSGPITVTLEDSGVDTVTLTINTFGLDNTLDPPEKIANLHLNLDPTLDPDSLIVSFPTDNTTPHGESSTGTDAFKADGDGWYDILIEWDKDGAGRLLADLTDTITFTLTGLTEESFLFENTPGGGNGTFLAAMHVQGLGDNGGQSGWYAATDDGGFDPGDETLVPEPGSLALFGFGLASLGLAIRRRRSRSP